MSTKTGSVRRAPETRAPLEATRPPRKKERSRREATKRRQRGTNAPGPNLAAPSLFREPPARRRKRRALLALSVLMIAIGVGLLLYPFLPWIRYTFLKPAPVAEYETALSSLPAAAAVTTDEGETIPVQPIERSRKGGTKPKPAGNRLVIPKIRVDVEIVGGSNQDDALNRGIWHIPGTSSPDRGSNTVLSGHRFRYLSGPKTLYLLDRLEKGDPIIVYWKGKEYDYVVVKKVVVTPKSVEILDPTENPRLTVFTCAPLFSTKERLVLIAKPI